MTNRTCTRIRRNDDWRLKRKKFYICGDDDRIVYWKWQRFDDDNSHLSTTTHWKCFRHDAKFNYRMPFRVSVWLKFTSRRNNRMAHEIKMTKRYRTHDCTTFVYIIVSFVRSTLRTSWFASKNSNAQIRWIDISLLFPCMWFWGQNIESEI